MQTVFDSYKDIPFTEGVILQFHAQLLKYSEKDKRQRGRYKSAPNKVVAFDGAGGLGQTDSESLARTQAGEALGRWPRDEVSKSVMPYFNEIYSTDGQVRPHYAGLLDHWKVVDKIDHQLLISN